MIIEKIEAIPYKIPYLKPLEFATGVITDVEHVLIRVHTKDGVVGQAEAPSRPYIYGESQASIVAAVNDWFAPSVVGLDIRNVERVHQKMKWVVHNHTARAAVDLAVWDALGKTLVQPCHVLLGGYADSLRVSDMIGYGSPGQMVEHATKMKERYGIDAFKIKTGRNIDEDVAACRALRKAMPTTEFYLDSNHGWTADEAIYAARATADLRLAFFEEPCPAADRQGRRRLLQALDVPICGDESCTSLMEVARELSDGACQMVSIKTARTGFTESRRIGALCEGLSAPVVMGNQGDTMVGTLATLSFGAAFRLPSLRPAEMTNYFEICDDLLAEPLVIQNGQMKVSSEPGIGVTIDEAKLKHYRID